MSRSEQRSLQPVLVDLSKPKRTQPAGGALYFMLKSRTTSCGLARRIS